MNAAMEALNRAVNRAIAEGSPVYVNQPAPVVPRYGISHAAMILRLAVDEGLDEGTGENEKIAAFAAIATLAELFNGDHGMPRYQGMTPREIYEIEYKERGGETEVSA